MIYFTAHTFKCVCHCRRAMFRVLGMYNFGYNLHILQVFLGWLFVFYDANHDFDNKDIRVAGFNIKIFDILIMIPALEWYLRSNNTRGSYMKKYGMWFFQANVSYKKRKKELDFTNMIPQVDFLLFVFCRLLNSLLITICGAIIWVLSHCTVQQ